MAAGLQVGNFLRGRGRALAQRSLGSGFRMLVTPSWPNLPAPAMKGSPYRARVAPRRRRMKHEKIATPAHRKIALGAHDNKCTCATPYPRQASASQPAPRWPPPQPARPRWSVGIDTACVQGTTGIRPGRELVHVPARQKGFSDRGCPTSRPHPPARTSSPRARSFARRCRRRR